MKFLTLRLGQFAISALLLTILFRYALSLSIGTANTPMILLCAIGYLCLMAKLKEAYPTKQIILLTPIHRGDAFLTDRNVQPDEMHANGVGEYVDAYIDVIKEAGNVWAVPVIDLNSISGLYPLAESNALYWRRPSLEKSENTGGQRKDRLHPNSEGHLRMARALAYQLLGYPAKFD